MSREIYRRVAWKFINLRQGKGLTQIQLGEKTGMSRQQISRVEGGLGDTTLENICRLAGFFEISMEELFRPKEAWPLEIKVRESNHLKSEPKMTSVNHPKAFTESPSLKLVCLLPKCIRNFRVDPKAVKDFYLLEGRLIVDSSYDRVGLQASQALSCKGAGFIKIMNPTDAPARLLIVGTAVPTY
jgi:DNA-binding XRE family transcriptional regulator